MKKKEKHYETIRTLIPVFHAGPSGILLHSMPDKKLI